MRRIRSLLLMVGASGCLLPMAANAQKVLCDGKTFDGNSGLPFVLTEQHSGSVIRNCTFKNLSVYAIRLYGASDVLIENCTFENLRGRDGGDVHAIAGPKTARRITIRNNRFVDIGADGVQFGDYGTKGGGDLGMVDIGDIQILDNEFWVTKPGGENGVDLKTVDGPILVAGNSFHGFRPCDGNGCTGSPGEGMVVHRGATGVTIERNRFFDNTIGLRVDPNRMAAPDQITIRNNWFYDNKKTGLFLEARSAWVLNNTFFNNADHIQIKDMPKSGGTCENANNLFVGAGGEGSDACGGRNNGVFDEAEVRFVDAVKRDLRLLPGSPALGKGADMGGTTSVVREGGSSRPPRSRRLNRPWIVLPAYAEGAAFFTLQGRQVPEAGLPREVP